MQNVHMREIPFSDFDRYFATSNKLTLAHYTTSEPWQAIQSLTVKSSLRGTQKQ